MNKKLSIYLKYNFYNNIHDCSKALGQYFIYYFFLKKFVFIQQGFVKLIETVIAKIDIVRKKYLFWINGVLLNFLFINEPKKVSQVPIIKNKKNKQHSCWSNIDNKSAY